MYSGVCSVTQTPHEQKPSPPPSNLQAIAQPHSPGEQDSMEELAQPSATGLRAIFKSGLSLTVRRNELAPLTHLNPYNLVIPSK